MTLLHRVRRTIEREQLALSSTRVVIALSGGPDSMALLHVLKALDEEGALRLVAAAHLNHQLRDAAAGDARFCAEVCGRLGLPMALESVDVRGVAAAERRSLEDAAHAVRHDFFARVVAAHQADVIALGHTKDDQAETFLLRLVRGAGSRGLASMYPRNGIVIRPMLDCSKDEVRTFLQQRGIPFVHDSSNDDVGIPRNRVRKEVLPLLRERFNPRIADVLAAEANLARAEHQFLQELADDWIATHVRSTAAGEWMLDGPSLQILSRPVAWRVLHTVMTRAAAGRPVGMDAVVRAWAVATEGGRFDAPGHSVKRVGAAVVLSSRSAGSAGRRPAVSTNQVPAFSHPLPIPGEVMIAEIGCVMSAEVARSAQQLPSSSGVVAVVPKDMVTGGLAVRNRRPGDRLLPSPIGHRKLQDVLVDRKIPRAERDRVPIVVDGEGRIVWVAGLVVSTEFRVTDPAQAVVILRLKGVGGSC